jgi:4-methyl-5(b-hydroxyethyl)-thiazole monophosphate biosynthesis
MVKRVLVPIANGTEEIEAVGIIDTLRRAGAEVTVASVEPSLQIKASRGVGLVADVGIADCAEQDFDVIVVPGGMPGAEHIRDSAAFTAQLKRHAAAGRWVAAICAAPVVVLQHHGLLEGYRATCFPSFAEQLHSREAAEERVVVDRNRVTSRGPGTAIEFALKLIELLFGADKAYEVGSRMQVLGF